MGYPISADEGRIIMIGTVTHEDCFLCWAKGSSSWKSYGGYSQNMIHPYGKIDSYGRIINKRVCFVGNLYGFYQEIYEHSTGPR